jgi:hypothetical protein
MQFFTLVLLVCLFIFLYCTYVLVNDDFIFLRRDVATEKLFNIIFSGGLVGLFVSRLFYGFFHIAIFKNLFTFLLIPYFPGLSLLGGVVGIGAYFLFLKTRKGNLLPIGRICDFFSIAFLVSLPIGFIGYYLFSGVNAGFIKLISQAVAYFILFIIFLKFLLPRLLNGKYKEGTVTFLFLACFSIINLISNAFLKVNILGFLKNFENIISILILFMSIGILIWYEGLFAKIKQLKRGK